MQFFAPYKGIGFYPSYCSRGSPWKWKSDPDFLGLFGPQTTTIFFIKTVPVSRCVVCVHTTIVIIIIKIAFILTLELMLTNKLVLKPFPNLLFERTTSPVTKSSQNDQNQT